MSNHYFEYKYLKPKDNKRKTMKGEHIVFNRSWVQVQKGNKKTKICDLLICLDLYLQYKSTKKTFSFQQKYLVFPLNNLFCIL